jgi:hypothetical protein
MLMMMMMMIPARQRQRQRQRDEAGGGRSETFCGAKDGGETLRLVPEAMAMVSGERFSRDFCYAMERKKGRKKKGRKKKKKKELRRSCRHDEGQMEWIWSSSLF